VAIEVGDAGLNRGQHEGPHAAAAGEAAEADDLAAGVDGAGVGEGPAAGGVDEVVEVGEGGVAPDDGTLAVDVADEVEAHSADGDARIVDIVHNRAEGAGDLELDQLDRRRAQPPQHRILPGIAGDPVAGKGHSAGEVAAA